MAPITILVAEDETIIGMELQYRLEDMGYRVLGIVPSGELAVEKAIATYPDLILMDIHLSEGIDGITAAERIQQRADIPIIFLTAHTDDKTLQRAKLRGPFAYLVKPFRERELDIAIQVALYKYQMERKLRESEERLRLLVESTNDIIYTQDLVGRFLYYHGATHYGFTADQVIGKTPADLFDEQTATDMLARNQQVIATGESITVETEILWNGTQHWFNQHIYPLKDAQGNITAIATVSRNVTETRRLKGILPICAWCGRKVKAEDGEWVPLDVYLTTHTEAQVSHGMCDECRKTFVKKKP